MINDHDGSIPRREFIAGALAAGLALSGGLARGQGRRGGGFQRRTGTIRPYAFRALSIGRLNALQEEFQAARGSDRLSRNKIFRGAVDPLSFRLPEEFRGARSIIAAAVFSRSAVAGFARNGREHSLTVPFQYFQDGWTSDKLGALVRTEFLKKPAARIMDVSKRVPLKWLAARAGLGRYGRNNLIFVEGMGSYCLLHAFLSDAEAPEESWSGLDLLPACGHCHGCDRSCPTGCITRSDFLIDSGRCLTLYNEVPGPFPNFILPSMHHALMGCLRCQTRCPENEWIPQDSEKLENVPEDETAAILGPKSDPARLLALRKRLRLFPAVADADFHPILKRNLGALIRA
jgi:epoxyqueuosine reductase